MILLTLVPLCSSNVLNAPALKKRRHHNRQHNIRGFTAFAVAPVLRYAINSLKNDTQFSTILSLRYRIITAEIGLLSSPGLSLPPL